MWRAFTIYGVFETANCKTVIHLKITHSYHHQGTKGTVWVPTSTAGCLGYTTSTVIH